MHAYDLVITGGGPAGISASLYAVSRGLKTLLLEKNSIGGTIGTVSTVTHYTGLIEHESGATFAARLKAQAERAGVEVRYEPAVQVSLSGPEKTVSTDREQYTSRAIILANGTTPRKLGIPGESKLGGHGMDMNAAKDGASFQGRNVYVVGGADGAIKEAIYLAQFAKKLTVIHFEDKLGAIPEFRNKLHALPNVRVLLHTRLAAVRGESHVECLELTDEHTGAVREVKDDGCGIFVYAGSIPNTELYRELKLSDGFIPVNSKMETELPGVYAAGDICFKQVRQVSTAVAEGAVAGIDAAAYLK